MQQSSPEGRQRRHPAVATAAGGVDSLSGDQFELGTFEAEEDFPFEELPAEEELLAADPFEEASPELFDVDSLEVELLEEEFVELEEEDFPPERESVR